MTYAFGVTMTRRPESLRLPIMATSESTPPATAVNARRSVGDWIRAGYDIMAEEGLKAMTIDRLCRRLGVTKGSFYWHFTDMKAYRATLVESTGPVAAASRVSDGRAATRGKNLADHRL